MKILLTMILLLSGCACGPDSINRRTTRAEPIKWTVVDTMTLKIRATADGVPIYPGHMYVVSPIDVDISWTEPTKGKFNVTCNLSATETDEDTLGLGTCVIDMININSLEVCNGTDKCTVAAIRTFTVGDHAGFINTDGGYGVPLLSDGNAIGLTDANALTLDSYTIPGNDRRLRNNDFTDLSYDLTIDMSNAGAGEYATDLTIQLLLGI